MVSSNPQHELKTFAELSTKQLYQILKLRAQVFVLEQTCAYQDMDDLDQQALHLYSEDDSGQIVAYARITAPNQSSSRYSSIGRVVVDPSHRHKKLGHALMQAAIDAVLHAYPEHPLKISAQSYLTHFYENLGFVNTGKYYLEDQISHQEMLYQPK